MMPSLWGLDDKEDQPGAACLRAADSVGASPMIGEPRVLSRVVRRLVCTQAAGVRVSEDPRSEPKTKGYLVKCPRHHLFAALNAPRRSHRN